MVTSSRKSAPLRRDRRLKRLIVTLLTVASCAGCVTRLSHAPEKDTTASANMVLAFQNRALDPENGGQLASVDSLHPGDIILSATHGIISAGIRLFTLAPVSHAALYVGDQQVADATVGEGVRIRTIDQVLAEESVVVAFRHPQLNRGHAEKIREFSMHTVGRRFNYIGMMLQAPFSLERRVCELPLIPEVVRDYCIRGIATIQLGAISNDRFFCSQFVLEAYRYAGLPITDADPRWISPVDILHMREGDVPSMRIHQALLYVGHLKYRALSPTFDENTGLQQAGH